MKLLLNEHNKDWWNNSSIEEKRLERKRNNQIKNNLESTVQNICNFVQLFSKSNLPLQKVIIDKNNYYSLPKKNCMEVFNFRGTKQKSI